MKHSRLVLAAVATLTLGTWATLAFACEGKTKTTAAAASSKSSACTAEMAAKCTPEMAAACKAKGATAASMAGCPHSTSATTAAYSGSTVNTVASGGCGAKATSATAATAAVQNGTQGVDAVLAGAGAGCSHGSAKSTSAVTAGAGGSCSGHGAKSTTAQAKHADCDACAEMAFCDGEVGAMGATVQVVPLKNGVMYVYTADDPNKVHAVQASMGHRNDRMSGMLAAGDKAKLCPSCKSVRGAIASGKLSREFVNIEGGCLTLMTSNDPATVARIYSLAGIKGPMSIKS